MMNNIQAKERLLQAFPPVPAGYSDSIDAVLQSLETNPFRLLHTGKPRLRLTPGKMVAAVLALIIIGSSCVFAASPALAADIPVINEIVYAVSATVEPDPDIQNKIASTVQAVLSGFISNATENIGARFKSGDNWALSEDTLLTAYYLHFEAASAELLNQGKTPALANIAVKNIKAEQKGFRYTATLTFDVLLDDETYATETVTAQLEESVSGFYITSLDIISEGFENYKAYIARYDRAEYGGGTLDENIANYNAILIARQMALDELEQHQQAASGTEMTRDEQLEDLAAELCYRYWSATEMPDMSDIMARNDDTELWFRALELRMELHTPVMAEKGFAEIWEITDKSDELITATVYVKTIISGGIGQTLRITFKSTGGKYMIVGFSSPWDDGLNGGLERLADQYINEGMSHSDANQKAYEIMRVEMIETIKKLEEMMEN